MCSIAQRVSAVGEQELPPFWGRQRAGGAADQQPRRQSGVPSARAGRWSIVLERRQGLQIVEGLCESVEPVLQSSGTLALLPGLGAILIVRLHLVAGGFQE